MWLPRAQVCSGWGKKSKWEWRSRAAAGKGSPSGIHPPRIPWGLGSQRGRGALVGAKGEMASPKFVS